jgi:hypothetical protein
LFRLKISMNRLPSPRVEAAMEKRDSALPSSGGGTM